MSCINNECTSQRQTTTKELYLPQSICNILFDETWWSNIVELAMLMKLYCGALDQMQADKARLYDKVLALSQIRADIHQQECKLKRECDEKKTTGINVFPINEIENPKTLDNKIRNNKTNQNLEDLKLEEGYITTEQDW
ncbi:14389_t:CDS:2 [Funneliformis caledonium]|uniref:14389_t:CDS:1 n=1 Tax=Funneliformis caledonium TaxID=1117310 RepID=A0A9N8ZCX9_9GLOM|nr:14389_t:CDS:2 [Funneliformis caledonium]